jgi:DNA-binding MarR family transcriptional regulator
VGEAIKQNKPFRSDAHEAVITLRMTVEKIGWPYQQLFAEHDLTPQQYNVLRILRGAGSSGLPTLELAERMVERTPGITRLIDRLERKGLVDRVRSPEDRRQVYCLISRDGLALLRRLDGPIDALDRRSFDPLTGEEVRRLIRLLDKVRSAT